MLKSYFIVVQKTFGKFSGDMNDQEENFLKVFGL